MWRIDQHTADVRIRVTASSLRELFAESVRALTAVMHPVGATGERVTATIEIEANDATALLVDFLNEVLTRSHIERVAFTETEFAALTETSLRAVVSGTRCEGFEEDVKSVTYHEAQVTPEWSTTLVLDI
jgi:SHS2 domain-containing protein